MKDFDSNVSTILISIIVICVTALMFYHCMKG
jgi:hypothetical protein